MKCGLFIYLPRFQISEAYFSIFVASEVDITNISETEENMKKLTVSVWKLWNDFTAKEQHTKQTCTR